MAKTVSATILGATMPNIADDQQYREQDYARKMGVDIPTARQMLANKQVQDTKILQKVNRAHHDAFAQRYPGQVEHCLRLTMERLQYGLDKRGNVDIAKPETWIMLPDDLRDLAQTAYYLDAIRKDL